MLFAQTDIDRAALRNHVEALIFAAEKAVDLDALHKTLTRSLDRQIDDSLLRELLAEIKAKFDRDDSAIELREIAGGYLLLTKADYHRTVSVLLNLEAKKKLSRAAMETLSIIAYKQPCTRGDIEDIRGVSADYSLQKLLEKDLIAPAGRAETVGRPLLYRTSDYFMQHFGLKGIEDLPKFKEIVTVKNSIGGETTEEPIDETAAEPAAEATDPTADASSE